MYELAFERRMDTLSMKNTHRSPLPQGTILLALRYNKMLRYLRDRMRRYHLKPPAHIDRLLGNR